MCALDLDHMPNKGTIPMVLSATAKAGGSPVEVTGNVTVPRAFIEDLVTSFLQHVGL